MVEGIYYYEHEVKMTEHWSFRALDGEGVLNLDGFPKGRLKVGANVVDPMCNPCQSQ
jgi:hypothetical protein